MVCSPKAEAKLNSGNYINGAGCLVVWTDHSFLGIHWGCTEVVFCNTNGVPIIDNQG